MIFSVLWPDFAEIKAIGIPLAWPRPFSSYFSIHLTAFFLNLSSTRSHLLATTITDLPSSSTFLRRFISADVKASIASIITATTWEYYTAVSTYFCTYSSIVSIVPFLTLTPAVSTSVTLLPAWIHCTLTASRVVPAKSFAITLDSFSKLLTKVDLPVFGLPIIDSCIYFLFRAFSLVICWVYLLLL